MRVNINVMRLMIGLILRMRVPVLKGTVTCQNSQKGDGNDRLQFTANNERAVQTLKPSSAPKRNALREFFVIFLNKNLLVNLPTGFPASSNHCRCTVAYAAI